MKQNIQITFGHHGEGGKTGALVAAVVSTSAAGAGDGGAAGGAAGRAVAELAELAEAVSAGGAGKAVPVAVVAGFATLCTATVAAVGEVGLPVKAVVVTGGVERALAAREGSGFSSLALVASVGGRSRRRLLLESASQNLVHKGEGHPGVGTTVPVNGAPAGVGGQNFRRAGTVLGGEKVTSWYDLTRRVRAQPSLDELVEPDQVHVELQR